MHAGKRKGRCILLPFQLAVLVGIAITYTVVGGDSLAAFANHMSPHGTSGVPQWGYYLVFGGLQVLLSMVGKVATCYCYSCCHMAVMYIRTQYCVDMLQPGRLGGDLPSTSVREASLSRCGNGMHFHQVAISAASEE